MIRLFIAFSIVLQQTVPTWESLALTPNLGTLITGRDYETTGTGSTVKDSLRTPSLELADRRSCICMHVAFS